MTGFIEYTSRIYKRLVADGVMRGGMEDVPFNDIVLHATADERARLGELLVEESGRQGENKEAVRKEWDALVEGILKYGAKEPLKDVQPHADEEWGMPFHLMPHGISTQYSGLQKSKHQCNRKPRPKRRGVKHGNRKKKK
jgi:hypothetical protein